MINLPLQLIIDIECSFINIVCCELSPKQFSLGVIKHGDFSKNLLQNQTISGHLDMSVIVYKY